MTHPREDTRQDEPTRAKKNWLEWSVFAVGLLLVTMLLGYLIYDSVMAPSGPPRLTVRLGEPRQQAGQFVVPVAVENRGFETAEQVHVEVELMHGSGASERADFVIQFVPRESTRRGTVTFKTDPRAAPRMTPRVLGYQRP